MPTLERTVKVVNTKGLHMRAATVLAQTASRYRSTMRVRHGEAVADARSVMNLLLLTAVKGAELHLEASGEDAEQAMGEVVGVIERGFFEES